jgi:predicted N-acetyltransferase YhbS
MMNFMRGRTPAFGKTLGPCETNEWLRPRPIVPDLTAVCVAPEHDRTGVGRRLVTGLEGRASERGLSTLHLVTPITAALFHLRIGYRPAAPAVFETAGEPLEAVLMGKSL